MAKQKMHRPSFLLLSWRFLSGAEMDGEVRTNAGWFFPGNAARTVSGWAPRWNYRPRIQRAGIRQAWLAGFFLAVVGMFNYPVATIVALLLLVAWKVTRKTVKVQRKRRDQNHYLKYVLPIGGTIGQLLNRPYMTPNELDSWLSFPIGFFNEDKREPLRAKLSPVATYSGQTMKSVEKLVAQKVGRPLDELDRQWDMVGNTPSLQIRLKQRPPKKLLFSEIAPQLREMTDNVIPLGVSSGGKLVTVDLDVESPHIGFSCRSGVGKSVVVRFIISYLLHRAAQIYVLDAKGTSQKWCAHLPGVHYATDGKQFFDQLLELDEEMTRRFEVIKNTPQDEVPDVGPRIMLVFEELNVGMAKVTDYWDQIKNDDEWKGRKNPAVRALFNISCAGREAKMHLFLVAQKFDNASVGMKTAIRTNFGTRIIRGEQAMWKILAPECAPFPRQPKNSQRGRMHIVIDGAAVEFQAVLQETDEAEAYASSGAGVTVPETWMHPIDQPKQAVTDRVVTQKVIPVYNLREAVDAGLVGDMTYANLRARKSRSIEFPPPADPDQNKWTADQLQGWYATTQQTSRLAGEEGNDALEAP